MSTTEAPSNQTGGANAEHVDLKLGNDVIPVDAHVPLDVLRDTTQPFPTFSEICADALKAIHAEIALGPF